MRYQQPGCLRVTRHLAVVIQMNQIRLQLVFQIQEPFACAHYIGPRILHPFEFEVTLEYEDITTASQFLPLFTADSTAHSCETYFDPVVSQSSREFERIVPDAADGI